MSTICWPEIEIIKTESRHELTLSGSTFFDRVKENDGNVDESLFEAGKNLNYLKLENIMLSHISSKISLLDQLTNLVICNNQISEIPNELCHLTKLLFLDLSNNKISFIPPIFSEMNKLRTILLRNNEIKDISSLKGLNSLQELFVEHNKLNNLPIDLFDLENVMTLGLSNNEFQCVPENMIKLKNLKTLEMENNKINSIPTYLCNLAKLKVLKFKGNPLKNEKTQLKKMINDNLYKPILDYLRKNDKQRPKNSSVQEDNSQTKSNKIFIKVLKETADQKLTIRNRSQIKRNQVAYFVVKKLNLQGIAFKNFIKFQESLHKSFCDNRKHATIGFHNLSSVQFPLTYIPEKPDTFSIQCMNSQSVTVGSEFYDLLLKEAEKERKQKKRNAPSGVHQYLFMIDIEEPQGVVKDDNDTVISFPPLTNSDITKLTPESTDVMVEVIGIKLDHTKDICCKIIKWLLENNVSADGDCLSIQPMRVYEIDADGVEKMLVVYPNSTDLENFGHDVSRE